jgi:hypothetical protein
VLALIRGAAWTQLAAMLRSLLAEDEIGGEASESLAGMPSGDLFALANAVAALLDAPVTIEDRNSRVVAFSGRQDEADQTRIDTILGRQVSDKNRRLLLEGGVFSQLDRSGEPMFIDARPLESDPHFLPRVAVAVRAGDEMLGSIWAVVREPLSEERTQALSDSAKIVALHMLRVRAGSDGARRMRADLLSTALEGGAGSQEALGRLGLAGETLVVLALQLLEPTGTEASLDSDAGLATERQRLSDGLAIHLSAMHPRSAVALVGDIAYGLLPVLPDDPDADRHAVRTAGDFLGRVGARVHAVIGVGTIASDQAGLARAKTNANRALRVVRSGGPDAKRVARLADVQMESLVLELRDLAASHGDTPSGPVAHLAQYDAAHNANLVGTLRAWLDGFGDITAAAASMFVHPNTFRYRLRRVAEVSGIDLDDADERFAAMLQLRVGFPES